MKDYSKYIGMPWVYIENDCIAVVRQVLREQFGVNVPVIDLPTKRSATAVMRAFAAEKERDYWKPCELKEGAVVLFFDRHDKASHVGLFVGRGNVLHCCGSPSNPGQTMIQPLSFLLQTSFKRFELYEYNGTA